jgi:hypothetical protein
MERLYGIKELVGGALLASVVGPVSTVVFAVRGDIAYSAIACVVTAASWWFSARFLRHLRSNRIGDTAAGSSRPTRGAVGVGQGSPRPPVAVRISAGLGWLMATMFLVLAVWTPTQVSGMGDATVVVALVLGVGVASLAALPAAAAWRLIRHRDGRTVRYVGAGLAIFAVLDALNVLTSPDMGERAGGLARLVGAAVVAVLASAMAWLVRIAAARAWIERDGRAAAGQPSPPAG